MNELYDEATKLFLTAFQSLFLDDEKLDKDTKLHNAVIYRQSIKDVDGNSYGLNIFDDNGNVDDSTYKIEERLENGIQQWTNNDSSSTMTLRDKIILDAAVGHALGVVDNKNAVLNLNFEERMLIKNYLETIPVIVFKQINPKTLMSSTPINVDLILLNLKINGMQTQNKFTNALRLLVNELETTPDPIVTEATIKLLNGISGLPKNPTKKEIAAVFNEFETTCKIATPLENILKAVAKVIITGVFFAAGIAIGAVLGGAAGIAAGAWSGPGAAASAILGVFSGSLTGWAIAATATAAVTGVIFGATGAAGSSLFFKQASAVDKAVANLIAEGKAAGKTDFQENKEPFTASFDL